jgi:uncharacterized membrane protein YgaE (UPF0421/DUF939 family)
MLDRGINAQLRWIIAKDNPPSMAHVCLSAIAALVSYLTATLFRLPEAYWAPMSTLIVMQLTLSAALPVAVQYVAGTAAGAAVGAAIDAYAHGNVWAFAAAVLFIGFLCVVLRVERSSFRYASITLVIVMLVPRSTSARLVALHRFFEVSIGIGVGLTLFAIWQRAALRLSVKTREVSSLG